jgi:hypothetical protein
MTSGELKFALRVESVLNTIPQPEYRQLVVEALMVLTLVVEHNLSPCLGDILQVEQLVQTANRIFLQEQARNILTIYSELEVIYLFFQFRPLSAETPVCAVRREKKEDQRLFSAAAQPGSANTFTTVPLQGPTEP